jgi:Carbohydrate-selective porin, OprB family/S-layer homology domain
MIERNWLNKTVFSASITSFSLFISSLHTTAFADSLSQNDMEQVTSVSQLTDVQPTDWAFQALQSLVERYGCISGYPNKTFRGNRALTRYEFAAGINSCLDKINELVATATADVVKKTDLEVLQKLQESFAAEIATLRQRVDTLEARTAIIESQQFSTTTKLTGQAWLNLTGAFASGSVKYEGLPGVPATARFTGGRDSTGRPLVQQIDNAEPTLSALTWLTLTSSFSGKDSLVVQLAAGNGISPISEFTSAGFINTFGTPYTDQTSGTVYGQTDVVIQDLFYSFPVSDSLKVTIGPRINWFTYFDLNRFTYYLTGAGSYASAASTQSSPTFWGSGAVVEWNMSDKLRLAASYLGENIPYLPSEFGFNTSSNPEYGLFGGTNSTTAELAYSPTSSFNLKARYTYSRLQAYFGQIGGSNYAPLPYGYVDAGDGFSVYDAATGTVSDGGLDYAYAHTVAFNFDWLITPKFGLFGRYSFGNINLKPINQSVNTQSFQVGLGFPDLGKKGALGVITFLMPMDITSGRRYFVSGAGDGGTMYNLETSYYYPISDNVAVIPSFYTIFNPNNFDSNPNIYVGNMRMQFAF